MENITITKPNVKGQIVIPKKLRDELGIGPETPVEIMKQGRGIYIIPLYGAANQRGDSNEAWLQVLRETQGSWGPETPEEKKARLARRRRELARTKRMREAW